MEIEYYLALEPYLLYRGMRVKVKTLATLHTITGGLIHEITLNDEANVNDVIKKLIEMYPKLKNELLNDKGRLKENYKVLINGREITHLSGLETKVSDGDIIAIFPPVAGG